MQWLQLQSRHHGSASFNELNNCDNMAVPHSLSQTTLTTWQWPGRNVVKMKIPNAWGIYGKNGIICKLTILSYKKVTYNSCACSHVCAINQPSTGAPIWKCFYRNRDLFKTVYTIGKKPGNRTNTPLSTSNVMISSSSPELLSDKQLKVSELQ